MAERVDIAEIRVWGRLIGAIAWNDRQKIGRFEYARPFLESGIELSPLTMPLRSGVFEFPELRRETFHGLPGFLSDSLPDRFGNLLINQWLAGQGRKPEGFSPVERLCYIGERGMGALEFHPVLKSGNSNSAPLEIANLVHLANEALAEKAELAARLGSDDSAEAKAEAMREIIQVGTSAGGARAKAVVAWHPETGEVRSGQIKDLPGYEPWLIKFDGVSGNRDKEMADPLGYGKTEFAYYLMAKEAGIEMSECRLLRENGRSHFMTRRFDRTLTGKKLHMQSLCAMAHYDFNLAGATSYEQALQVMMRLNLPAEQLEQQFRRAVFNVLARNQDDHTKNIAFLMNKRGAWRLSPAYDVTFSYNPDGAWTGQHQMSANGKRDGFELNDLIALGRHAHLKTRQAKSLIEEVQSVLSKWPECAAAAGISEESAAVTRGYFRRLQ